MIKAIVFDFFGVIGSDVHWDWLRKNEPKLEDRKKFYEDISNQVDLGKINESEFIKKVANKTERDVTAVQEEMNVLVDINNQMVKLLEVLYKHYKIGLISSSNYELLEGILDKYNLRKYFQAIIISSRVGFLKSDSILFSLVADKLGVSNNEILYIDDHKENVSFAEKLGFNVILYNNFDILKQALIQYDIRDIGH